MAGYFRTGNHIYNGRHLMGADIERGTFVNIDADGLIQVADADETLVMRVEEKTELWGREAVALEVVACGDNAVYLLANDSEIDNTCVFDERYYVVKKDTFGSIKRPLIGEELVITVESDLYNTLVEGDLVTVADNGTIAKA